MVLRRAEFERIASVGCSTDGPVPRDPQVGHAHIADRLIQIAGEIARLESDLELRRSAFHRLLAGDGEWSSVPNEVVRAVPPALKPLARASSLPLRVQSVLDVSPRALTAHDVAAQISEPVDSVRAALSKLVSRGTVERVTVGVYRSIQAGHRTAAGDDD